jgi:Zn finger protein HypA/HybF involved in hydrogenase expression
MMAVIAKEAMAMVTSVDVEQTGVMVCPNCGADDPFPPTESDNATTTCPKCGHRFPVSDEPEPT